MNLQNKVSILIPVYNREYLIGQTLNSAINQTYDNIEIIVVDNASTDNTWEVIQRYKKQDKRIKAFRNNTNIGPVKNWCKCIDHATGKYAKILWSDDLISPDFIEKTVPWIEDKNVGFVFTGTEIFSNDKKTDTYFIGKSGVYNSEKYINGILSERNYPVSPGCALFRLVDLKKNLMIDIPNNVDSDFAMHAIGNDLLIFLLTANQYNKFAFVNKKLSFFRVHEGSISVQSNDGKLSLYYLLAKAHFVENYRRDLITKMNVNIWIYLKVFGNGVEKYKLEKIEDFYIKNIVFNIDFMYLCSRISRRVLRTIKRKLSV